MLDQRTGMAMSLRRKIEEAQQRAQEFGAGANSWKSQPLHERVAGKHAKRWSIGSLVVTILVFGALAYVVLHVIGFIIIVSAASWAK